jgi:hypothetical protein
MNDRSLMYQVSPEGLYMMDYYDGVEGFIKYALSNLKNTSGCNIRCLSKRCKN